MTAGLRGRSGPLSLALARGWRGVGSGAVAELRLDAGDTTAEVLEVVKAYVEEHLDEPLSVERLAEVAEMDRFQLSRAFRAAGESAPWSYVQERRVRRARELLHGASPLTDVALESGFCDQSHLTRVFKRHTGLTPGEYRRRCTNVQDGRASDE